MRNIKITVSKFGDLLVTVARTAPIENKVIVKRNGSYYIETISTLKLSASDVLGTTPVVPRVAPGTVIY